MKSFNSIFTSLIIILFSLSAQSQRNSLGPIAGVNISTLTGYGEGSYTPNFTAGLVYNYSAKSDFGLNAKLLYLNAGTEWQPSNDVTRLHYIQLPVSLVYYFGELGQKFRPKVYAGLYGGILLNATVSSENEKPIKITENTKKGDFGGQIGAGFNYEIKDKKWLNVDLTYQGGFSGVSKSIDNIKNRGFQIQVGMTFPITSDVE